MQMHSYYHHQQQVQVIKPRQRQRQGQDACTHARPASLSLHHSSSHLVFHSLAASLAPFSARFRFLGLSFSPLPQKGSTPARTHRQQQLGRAEAPIEESRTRKESEREGDKRRGRKGRLQQRRQRETPPAPAGSDSEPGPALGKCGAVSPPPPLSPGLPSQAGAPAPAPALPRCAARHPPPTYVRAGARHVVPRRRVRRHRGPPPAAPRPHAASQPCTPHGGRSCRGVGRAALPRAAAQPPGEAPVPAGRRRGGLATDPSRRAAAAAPPPPGRGVAAPGLLLLRLLLLLLLAAQPHGAAGPAAGAQRAHRPAGHRAAVPADPHAQLLALPLLRVLQSRHHAPGAQEAGAGSRRAARRAVRALHRLRHGARALQVPRPGAEAAGGDLRRGRRGRARRPHRPGRGPARRGHDGRRRRRGRPRAGRRRPHVRRRAAVEEDEAHLHDGRGVQEVPAVLPAGPIRDRLVRDGRRVQQRRPVHGAGPEVDGQALQVHQGHDTQPAAQHQQDARQGIHEQGHHHLRPRRRRRRHRRRLPEREQRERLRPAAQHLAPPEGPPRALRDGSPGLALRALPAPVSDRWRQANAGQTDWSNKESGVELVHQREGEALEANGGGDPQPGDEAGVQAVAARQGQPARRPRPGSPALVAAAAAQRQALRALRLAPRPEQRRHQEPPPQQPCGVLPWRRLPGRPLPDVPLHAAGPGDLRRVRRAAFPASTAARRHGVAAAPPTPSRRCRRGGERWRRRRRVAHPRPPPEQQGVLRGAAAGQPRAPVRAGGRGERPVRDGLIRRRPGPALGQGDRRPPAPRFRRVTDARLACSRLMHIVVMYARATSNARMVYKSIITITWRLGLPIGMKNTVDSFGGRMKH